MSETAHEMSTAGGRGHSISAKTFFVVLMITMTIGVVVFVFGTLLYLSGISREYRVNTWQLAVSQAGVLEKEDVEGKAKEILAIYDTFSEAERGDGTSPAYQEKFKGAVDEDFRQMQKKMRKMQNPDSARRYDAGFSPGRSIPLGRGKRAECTPRLYVYPERPC